MKKIIFIMLTGFLFLILILNIMIGDVEISLLKILDILVKHDNLSVYGRIIWNIRLPRAIGAMLLGGALSLSGYLLQTFFSNPIAGPFILGISHGAKLVVAIVMIIFLENSLFLNSEILIIAAFAGSMISMGFVLIVSSKVNNMSILVICGVMIGYICSAITDFLVTFADDSNIINLHNWSKGSFSGMTLEDVAIISVVVVIGVISAICISKPISAYQLGESHARNLGVNIRLFRVVLILLSSILSATVTAFAGPVSFVGVAVPHLIKNIFKTTKPNIMILGCFLGGAIFCLGCDLIARTVFAPTELSISTVTAIFGAPVVILIMINRRRNVS